jgi:hypothetical protein
MNWKTHLKTLSIVAALAGFGCASVPKPTEELGQSESALKNAQEAGAAQIPQAALELTLAQEELDKAREQIKNDQNDEAQQNLLRSRADAELAMALTRQGIANTNANGAQEQLKAAEKSAQ